MERSLECEIFSRAPQVRLSAWVLSGLKDRSRDGEAKASGVPALQRFRPLLRAFKPESKASTGHGCQRGLLGQAHGLPLRFGLVVVPNEVKQAMDGQIGEQSPRLF